MTENEQSGRTLARHYVFNRLISRPRERLVAPGVDIVSLRGSGVANVTGAIGLAGADSKKLSSTELPSYTTANGTSFSAPQVTGAIALMLEANPSLTPAQVKDILQRTATPLPPYYTYEVGTGMLNVHAAVVESAFPSRKIGIWRGTLDRQQVKFANDAPIEFSGTVEPGTTSETTLKIPDGALAAFRSDSGVTRLDLATAMVLSARVPQYLPGQSSYQDVRDPSTMLFVESVQSSPTARFSST